MIRNFFSKQFFFFLMTGGIAAVINFSSRILFNLWVNFSAAVILAYLSGMITAFILAKLFVFKQSRKKPLHSAALFCLVNLVGLTQTWLISIGLVYYLLPAIGVTVFTDKIAHAVGVVVPVFTSYLGHKYWSFR